MNRVNRSSILMKLEVTDNYTLLFMKNFLSLFVTFCLLSCESGQDTSVNQEKVKIDTSITDTLAKKIIADTSEIKTVDLCPCEIEAEGWVPFKLMCTSPFAPYIIEIPKKYVYRKR